MFGSHSPLPYRLGGSKTEGWTAAQHARVASDLAACVRTGAFAWLTFTTNGASAPTLISYSAMPGVGALWAPVLIGVSTGFVNVFFGAAWSDAYERPEPLLIRHAKVTACSTAPRIVTWQLATGATDVSTIEVHIRDRTGGPIDDTVTLRVT